MFASDPEQLNPSTFAEAAAGAGDLRPVFYGLLLLFAMVACAKLLSAAAEQARYAFEQFKQAVRTLFFALMVAMLVAALVLLAFADLLAQG
jgi:hypothetical protein